MCLKTKRTLMNSLLAKEKLVSFLASNINLKTAKDV